MRDWYRPSKKRRPRAILLVLCILTFIIAAARLGGYLADALSSRRQQQELSAGYHQLQSEAPEATAT